MTATTPEAEIHYNCRVVLDETLRRWPEWDADTDRGEMAHTASARGWGYLPFQPHGTRNA